MEDSKENEQLEFEGDSEGSESESDSEPSAEELKELEEASRVPAPGSLRRTGAITRSSATHAIVRGGERYCLDCEHMCYDCGRVNEHDCVFEDDRELMTFLKAVFC